MERPKLTRAPADSQNDRWPPFAHSTQVGGYMVDRNTRTLLDSIASEARGLPTYRWRPPLHLLPGQRITFVAFWPSSSLISGVRIQGPAMSLAVQRTRPPGRLRHPRSSELRTLYEKCRVFSRQFCCKRGTKCMEFSEKNVGFVWKATKKKFFFQKNVATGNRTRDSYFSL